MLLPFPETAQRTGSLIPGVERTVDDLPFLIVIVETFEPQPVRVRDEAIYGHAGLHTR
jgi:hypothetical protein